MAPGSAGQAPACHQRAAANARWNVWVVGGDANGCCTCFVLLVLLLLGGQRARALPSFAMQTGQPCAACHVGAFGPQLKQYGRDFKLYGYVASDGVDRGLPLAAQALASFTHTDARQSYVLPHYAPNDNFAVDIISAFYAGRITPWLGAFAELNYISPIRDFSIGYLDVRHAQEGELLGTDLVYGFTANNAPSVTDLWNSTPVWGFPAGAPLAPSPLAATLVDGGLSQRVFGGGSYVMVDGLVYLEADLYRGLGYDVLNATGVTPVSGTDKTRGVLPYWRGALQQDFGRHYLELGTFGLTASVLPDGVDIPGHSNRFTDTAVDMTYQFVADPKAVTSDMVSAHAMAIHETASRGSSANLPNHLPARGLNTVRADISYSIGATVTPTIQYFYSGGPGDSRSLAQLASSPSSSGVIFGISYVPWGKPDSPIKFGNLRLTVEYLDYFRVAGSSANASNDNALSASLWLAAHF